MGLSGDEIAAVKSTFKTFEADLEGTGTIFYVEFFNKFPQNKALFKSDDPNSAQFKHQAKMTMKKIGELVAVLDGGLDAKLKDLGVFHKGKNLTPAQFATCEGPMKYTLSKVLGAKYDATAQTGWDKVLKTIIAGVSKEL
ncbi:uncharacterized protein LOC141903668 [Tubulanus polymorphus]|uniref:uncharacterized protein LOC141903668 n=1 Tax=Tubulanus polymorphus TaxID=672921 RepID=UPI003DA1C959